jgi:hypothetical protein
MATKCFGVIFLVLVTLASVAVDSQAANEVPRVIPPGAIYRDLTYREWEARWWQAAYDIPVVGGAHPLISGGPFGGEDGVLFLAAVVGFPSPPVTIHLTIRPGTPLFVPVFNVECSVMSIRIPKPVRCRQPFPLTPCHRPRSCPGG